MFTKALIVAILYYVILVSWQYIAESFQNRPIVLGLLIGLVLGDVKTGCILGASLELIFMGATYMGGTLPTDPCLASFVVIPFAIISGMSTEAAIALAVPVGLLGVATETIMKLVYAALDPLYEKYANEGDQKGFSILYMLSLFLGQLLNPLIVFVAIYLGSDAITGILAAIPESILTAIEVAGAMLPAVGLGLILNMLFSWRFAIYFVCGFAAYSFFEWPTLAVFLLAILFAFIECVVFKPATKAAAADKGGFLDE